MPTEIIKSNIADELSSLYMTYAMSVITDRALPDVRDGLKPVHRRVLFDMHENGMSSNKPRKKSAVTVGSVLGAYHPHGDSSVYEAMVRLAQPFSLNVPLVDGKEGNWGALDGSPAAHYRYTTTRLTHAAEAMLKDINKNTVKFKPNYDNSKTEPEVLPAKFPHLLTNGTMGIAVGMACSFVPHNQNRVVSAIQAQIDNPAISIEELVGLLGGPDFPTGGIIINQQELLNGYQTGRGRIRVRARACIKEDEHRIEIEEIPYMTRRDSIIGSIHKAVEEGRITGIDRVEDDSEKGKTAISIWANKNVSCDFVLNQLYRETQLERTISLNMRALVNGEPKTLNLKEIIQHYIDHQIDVVKKATQFDLDKVLKRLNIVQGLLIALKNIDTVISIIRNAGASSEARENLMRELSLNEEQARAILDMRLGKLTKMEGTDLEREETSLIANRDAFIDILNKPHKQYEILKSDLRALGTTQTSELKTTLTQIDRVKEEKPETLIPVEDFELCLFSNNLFYVLQKGAKILPKTKEILIKKKEVNTYSDLILFSNHGRAFKIKGHELLNTKNNRLSEIVKLKNNEYVVEFDVIGEYTKVYMFTQQGLVKAISAEEINTVSKRGSSIIKVRENDNLLFITVVNEDIDTLILGSNNGRVLKFKSDTVPITGKSASGVIGIKLESGAQAIRATLTEDELTKIPIQGRNTKGIKLK